MCDCFQSAATTAIRCSGTQFRKLCLDRCNWRRKPLPFASEIVVGYKDCSFITNLLNNNCIRVFGHQTPVMDRRVRTRLGVFGSNEPDLSSENLELGMQNGREQLKELELGFMGENEAFDDTRTRDSLKGEKCQNDELGMLNFDEPLREEGAISKAEDLMAVEDDGKNENLVFEEDQVEEHVQSKSKSKRKPKTKLESRSRNQLMKRSSILAKQVIGIESARSLGFVSQLWVDTANWAVLEVEVRPNLLSSESVKFLLEDVNKVGDVVLVEDENCILNEYRTAGLESLVGCSVVTPGQRNLGKVRGYTFNINSGTVESLELDAFGYSVIPSSLVSTYALSTEDVLEVVSDVIIVHEAAASHIQRLTKGFMGTKNTEISSINLKYHDLELDSAQPVKDCKTKRKSSKRKSKFQPRARDPGDDFELPMDYM